MTCLPKYYFINTEDGAAAPWIPPDLCRFPVFKRAVNAWRFNSQPCTTKIVTIGF